MTRASMRRLLIVGLITGSVGVTGSSADDPSAVPVGARVRVTAPAVSGKRLVGTVVRMDDAILALRPGKGKDVVEVARSAITRFEVSRARSRKGKGANIGALVGLGAAVAIGFAAGEDCGSLPEPAPGLPGFSDRLNRNLCIGKGTMAAITALLTVPAGALIGAGAAPGERWVRTTPDRLSLAVGPVRGGTGVGAALSVRF